MKYLGREIIPGRLVYIKIKDRKIGPNPFDTLFMLHSKDVSLVDKHRIEISSFISGEVFWVDSLDIEQIQPFPYQMQDQLVNIHSGDIYVFDRMHLAMKPGYKYFPKGDDIYRERYFLLIPDYLGNHSYTSGPVKAVKVTFEDLIKNYTLL